MHLRRVFAILLFSVFIAAFVFTGVAFADDNDGITLSQAAMAPASLPNDGQDHQVTVTLNVAVDSSRAAGGLTNVHIGGTGVASSDSIDSISIGSNHDISCVLTVSASQLGSDIKFQLAVLWDGGGQYPFTVTVKTSSPAVPQVAFTRTMDKTSVDKGGSVVVTYRVENTGSIDIGNLTFTDSGVGTGALKTKDALVAGDIFEFTYTQVINADFSSQPKLTYTANGTNYTATCAAKTVLLRVEQLDVLLESSPETTNSGDQAVLQCTITNSGNSKLSNVDISENTLGNKLFPVFSIDPGVSKRFTWPISLTETAKFQFVITATDEAGNTYTYKSNFVTITVSSTGQDNLEFTANSDAIRLAEPGNVNFSFTINNKGDVPLANAKIVDQDGNVIKSLGSLSVGETAFNYQANVQKTKTFNFCLVVPNSDGTDYKVYTGPLQIEVASATLTPSASVSRTAVPQPSGTDDASASTSAASGSLGKMSALITALLVVGVLIAITIIVLIAMIISDKRRHRS